jgi:phosphoglycerate dehydrogenase-like enzyme
MLKGIYILSTDSYHRIYSPEIQKEIGKLVDIYTLPQTKDSIRENLSLLHEADVIFSGWGGPLMDELFLQSAPKLKAVFYGAGSIRGIVTEAFWERNILITSSYAANAIPVAEFTLSQILYCLKNGWSFANMKNREMVFEGKSEVREEMPGIYGSTVGIISLGMIGRMVCELLAPFHLNIIAYDPFTSTEDAAKLNVELCGLDELFVRSDVVSLHTPWLKETEGMITRQHFASMKRRASFINTARGAVINELEMIQVLQERTDIQAVLDVTHPEPPLHGSLLYTLPNVVLTPHIAGSASRKEVARMGSFVLDELQRLIQGQPPKWGISREQSIRMA